METTENSLVEYGSRRIIITVVAVVCAMLELIDTTIVNVALNDLRGNLGATVNEIGWVITAYSLANVIIVPMTSWLSQQFGRRNYFAVSILVFTICSVLCGSATNIWQIMLYRFVQGLGGGALLVTSQTIIAESWPSEKRAVAQGIYTLGLIIGPTIGPTLGGYLIDHYSWPVIFYINVPIGIVATVLSLQYVRSPRYEQKRPANEVDWLGIILLTVGVSSLQYVLEKGQEDDWFSSKLIIILTVMAVFGIICFIWRQLNYRYPIVELRVLRNTNLRIGTILTFLIGFGLFGTTFVLPLYTQSLLGWSAFQSGILLLPGTLFVAVVVVIVSRLIQRGVSSKYLIVLGMLTFFVYGYWSYHLLTLQTGSANLYAVLFVRGLGLGLLYVPVTTMSLSTLEGKEIAQGAALTGMFRQLGGAFGVALISTFIARESQQHRVTLVSHLNQDDPTVQQRLSQLIAGFQQRGFDFLTAKQSAYAVLESSVQRQSTLLSYMDVFLWVGYLFLVSVPLVLIFVKESQRKTRVIETAGH
ncbi:DHA2 family efflux MFS transporter permease subunit [Chitinophaga pinensis]|uniref:Drug resistance transporter, EmrB/QacA subfamily n=1 Tax=Chitinophaga pinensis (strain ATCC 43595 / DSM 2588 / LMG 13176 / NBRC 15968 / NCIMB 11800 / UQM 2034) TaxID=485918 RepID=A0A979GMR5_CHIPD|nr:DHA2 family efflux MFS transporter permease subunit [Chitinophaga pinensis]ACU58807.1 drug resistance transporter, EmrB/QacA subfamily [Chitinophaga pinensis DSM 2588]